jgi:hypothetical protein
MASPFAGHIAPQSGPHIAGCHFIDWRPRSARGPKVLALEDYDVLSNSRALFARKFDETRSAALLSVLERERVPAAAGRAKSVAA